MALVPWVSRKGRGQGRWRQVIPWWQVPIRELTCLFMGQKPLWKPRMSCGNWEADQQQEEIQWEPRGLLCWWRTVTHPGWGGGSEKVRGEGAGEGGIPVNTTNSCKCRHCLRNPGTWDPKWSVSVLSFIRLTLLSFSLSIFSPVIPCYSLPDTLSLPCAWTASNHVSRTWRFASVGWTCMTRWTRAKPLSSRTWPPAHPPTWPWPSTTSWTLSTTRWVGAEGKADTGLTEQRSGILFSHQAESEDKTPTSYTTDKIPLLSCSTLQEGVCLRYFPLRSSGILCIDS